MDFRNAENSDDGDEEDDRAAVDGLATLYNTASQGRPGRGHGAQCRCDPCHCAALGLMLAVVLSGRAPR